MTTFIKNSSILFVFTALSLLLLDVLYTKVYTNSFPRNKTQHILNLKKEKTIDYVFLGSSRVENTIMPIVIEKLTNKKAINLGTQGARLDDLNIFLRLLIDKKIKMKRLFVQVDYIYNFDNSSSIVRSQALPYIRSNSIINKYLKRVDTTYLENYYLPFYRYAKQDYRIGFREFFSSLINKKSRIDFKDGFVPVYGVINKNDTTVSSLPEIIKNKNKSIIEIDSLCKANNIKVTYFCAPFCSNIKTNDYLVKLKTKLPNFKDFSTVVKNDSLFNNCSHLNEKGALFFTKHLVEKLKL